MTSIHSLPAELVLRIYDFCDPGQHLDLSLISKHIARHSMEVLKYHRKCREVFHTIEMDGYLTVHDLYKQITRDHVAAWHVRALGIRDVRSVEKPWRTDHERLQLELQVDAYLDGIMWQWDPCTTQELPNKAYTLKEACQELKQEATLAKQILIILTICPRLSNLDIFYEEQEDGVVEALDNPPAKSLHLLGTTLQKLHAVGRRRDMALNTWHPGLISIRKLHIEGSKEHGVRPVTVASFFLLPRVSNLHITNLDTRIGPAQNNLHSSFPSRISERSSNVQHLFFDGARGDAMVDILGEFIKFCMELKSVVFSGCNSDSVAHLVHELIRHHGRQLQTLMFVGDHTHSSFQRYDLANMEVIRTLTLDVLDIVPAGSRRSEIEVLYSSETRFQFIDRFVGLIPKTVETLIFRPSASQRLNDAEMLKVGDALIQLIQHRNYTLRMIYVDEFEAGMRDARCKWGKHTDGGWLQNVKTHAEGYGITVYTQEDEGATELFTDRFCDHTFGL